MNKEYSDLVKEIITERKTKEKYQVYHPTYSSAVDAALVYATKEGYEVKDDDVWSNISTGPKKPSKGKTNRITIPLYRKEQLQKKSLHFQVYNMDNERYELNMYIS